MATEGHENISFRKAVMTRIMTITSGLPGMGKTHLAINIALEQVRRGRQVGVFYARESATPVDKLLLVQQPVSMLRRVGDSNERGLLRSGYQGVDIISCGTPLREWPTIQVEQRTRCIKEMDVQEGYDDFLIDTSGMDARTLLACCRASGVVVLVVTPEPRSRAEAFALVRVLQLNGFAGLLRLIVNKARCLAEAKEIHDEFHRQVNSSLGQDVPLLGVLPLDEKVNRAQRVRQAFNSVFPESEAAAGIVVVADALEDIPVRFSSGPRTLPALWHDLIDVIQLPVMLAGDTLLNDEIEITRALERQSEAAVLYSQDNETGLFQFQGNLENLCAVRGRLKSDLQVFLTDLDAFVDAAGQQTCVLADAKDGRQQRNQIINLVSRLLGIVEAACPMQSFRFQAADTVVSHSDAAWLQAGRYMKYIFHMMQSELSDTAQILLLNVPAINVTTGADGETIYELIDTVRHSYLNVISDPQNGVRIQAWLTNEVARVVDVVSLVQRRAPAG
jgi:flagellar biosynthesis protein FlhG